MCLQCESEMNELDFVSLARIASRVVYIAMLFILQLTCITISAGQMRDKRHARMRYF